MLMPLHSRISSPVHFCLGRRSHPWLCIALGLLLILSWPLPASAITVQDIPNPRAHGGWVSDTADQISAPMERRLNGLITFLEAETTAEMAIVTIPDTPPTISPKDFATALFNTWGVGKAEQHNGVLLLLSMADRRIELELGRGMEDVLSADRLSSLIRNTLRPLLQAGNVDQALWTGVGAIVTDLTGINPDAPAVLPWAPPLYTTFLVLGIACLVGGGLSLRWHYQQPAPLPPTGSQSFSHYAKSLQDIDFDRLVQTTPHRPKRPFRRLLLLACSFPLIAAALTFWASSLWVIPFDTHTNRFLFLTVLLAIALGLLLPLYLDPWLHPAPNNPPFNPLQSLGMRRNSAMSWGNRLLQWAIALGIFSYVAATISGGTLVLWLLYNRLWSWATPFTPTLALSVATPLFVAPGNTAIVAYYLREARWLSRPVPGYCCEICHGEIVDLPSHAPALRAVLPSRPNTIERAWYCTTCHPTLSEDGIFRFTETKHQHRSTGASLPSTATRTATKSRPSSSYDHDDTTWSIPAAGDSDFGGGSSDGGGVGDSW